MLGTFRAAFVTSFQFFFVGDKIGTAFHGPVTCRMGILDRIGCYRSQVIFIYLTSVGRLLVRAFLFFHNGLF